MASGSVFPAWWRSGVVESADREDLRAHGGACGYAEGHTHAYAHTRSDARTRTDTHIGVPACGHAHVACLLRHIHVSAHTRVSTHTCTQAHSPGASGRQGARPPRGRVPFAHLIQKLSARKPGGEQNVKCVLRGAACPLSWRAMIWSVSEHDELRIICAFRAGFVGGPGGRAGVFASFSISRAVPEPLHRGRSLHPAGEGQGRVPWSLGLGPGLGSVSYLFLGITYCVRSLDPAFAGKAWAVPPPP